MGSATRALQAVTFLDLLSCSMIGTQLAPNARSLGGSHIAIGLMGALYAGFQMLCGPLTGSLSDIKGRKSVLIVTISMSGVAYILMGMTSSLLMLLLLRSFIGAVQHTQVIIRALAPDYDTSIAFGKLEALGGLGMSIAPIIGGHIMEWFPESGFTMIAVIVGAISAVIAGLIQQLPKEEIEKGRPADKTSAATLKLIDSIRNNCKQCIEQFYKVDWNVYSELFLFRLLLTICAGVYFCSYAPYLKYQYNVSPSVIGYVTSTFWTVSSIFIYFIEHIKGFYDNPNDLTIKNCHVFLVLTLSFLGMLLAPNVLVFSVFVFPLAMSISIGRVLNMEVIMSKAENSHRGTVMGVATNVRNISGVLAPIIGGVVGQYIGISYTMHVCLALAGIATYRSYKCLSFDKVTDKRIKSD